MPCLSGQPPSLPPPPSPRGRQCKLLPAIYLVAGKGSKGRPHWPARVPPFCLVEKCVGPVCPPVPSSFCPCLFPLEAPPHPDAVRCALPCLLGHIRKQEHRHAQMQKCKKKEKKKWGERERREGRRARQTGKGLLPHADQKYP